MINRFHIINGRYDFTVLNEIYLYVDELGPVVLFNPYGFGTFEASVQNSWSLYFNRVGSDYYVMGSEHTRDKFVARLTEEYPDDMTWILFHPEVLDGRWDR